MKIDKALEAAFSGTGKMLRFNTWSKNEYMCLIHDTLSKQDGRSYIPTVKEMNSDGWSVIND